MAKETGVEEVTEEATASDVEESDIVVDDGVEEATASSEEGAGSEETGQESADEASEPTGETSTGEADDEEAGSEDPSQQQHKTGDERFNDLTKARYEAEAQAKVAEEKYQETLKLLEAAKNPPKTENTPEKLQLPPMPTRESADFDDVKYAAAMDEYQGKLEAYYDQKFTERFEQQAASRAQVSADNQRTEAANKIDSAFQLRQNEFIGSKDASGKSKHPDYEQVVFRDNLMIPTVVIAAIKENLNGPELLYQIAKSPKLAQKLLDSSPTQALMELGRLSAASNAAITKKKTTKAPDPIDPVNDSGETHLYDDMENMPIGDFIANENKKYYQV